jgi:predicted dehydrogenase
MVKFWMEHNRRDWHLSAATGGGMLFTAGIHALDRLIWLMDAPVEAVAAMSSALFHDHPVADVDLLLLRFAGGGLGEVTSAGNLDRTTWNSTELSCEGGTLLLDFDRGVRLVRGGREEMLPGSTEPDWMLRGVEREWRDMVRAIQGLGAPRVGGAEGAHIIACIAAAQEAARTRREVALPRLPAH